MAVEYDNGYAYVQTCASLKEQLSAVDAIIAALLATALSGAANDGIKEYMLDDGQTRIREEYNSSAAVFASRKAWETFRQELFNKINGRVMHLTDHSSNNIKR